MPVPVLTEYDVTPEADVTGAAASQSAETINAFDVTTDTSVPVSTPVSANFTASAAFILLSDGTVTTAAPANVFASFKRK